MDISNIMGEVETSAFWPKDAVSEAFKKAEGAIGNSDELEQLRTFYHTMRFLYDISVSANVTVPPQKIKALYEYAKKGFEAKQESSRGKQHGKT